MRRSFTVDSSHLFFGHLADGSKRSERVQFEQFISADSIETLNVRVCVGLLDFNQPSNAPLQAVPRCHQLSLESDGGLANLIRDLARRPAHVLTKVS